MEKPKKMEKPKTMEEPKKMEERRKIKSALISVYYKDKLEPILRMLHKQEVKIYSTGGTEKFIRELGIPVTAVEDITNFPSILGGRVKTLHPAVFGGILSRRNLVNDQAELDKYNLPAIDLVIVDLYPFEETLAAASPHNELIEKIDIGGISLIRAGAKNYTDIVIIASKDQYPALLNILENRQGESTLQERLSLAKHAFHITSDYDTRIFNYLNELGNEELLNEFRNEELIPAGASSENSNKASEKNSNLSILAFKHSVSKVQELRYGENPHQKGYFFGDLEAMFSKLGGKELSYNNLVDVDAGIRLIDEFYEPTFSILKHTNACGLASRSTVLEAWKAALAADPVSAFGGVLVSNTAIDEATAIEISKLFFEVLVAPAFEEKALEILLSKKNRIILQRKPLSLPDIQFKSLLNGVIQQDQDLAMERTTQMHPVTKVKPSKEELEDLVFALKLVKHTKSNAIILVHNRQLLASGVGQTSRVDALQQAIHKAGTFHFNLKGAVMASDAFFPFSDCVEIAGAAGISAIVQPGGSIKDQDSINAADNLTISMVVTGIRHFKH